MWWYKDTQQETWAKDILGLGHIGQGVHCTENILGWLDDHWCTDTMGLGTNGPETCWAGLGHKYTSPETHWSRKQWARNTLVLGYAELGTKRPRIHWSRNQWAQNTLVLGHAELRTNRPRTLVLGHAELRTNGPRTLVWDTLS